MDWESIKRFFHPLLHRVWQPTLLLHFFLWFSALILSHTFLGDLWPSRWYDFSVTVFGTASIVAIVLYWMRGLIGLYVLLATYGCLWLTVLVVAAKHMEKAYGGLQWGLTAILLLLPIAEIYSLISAEHRRQRAAAKKITTS